MNLKSDPASFREHCAAFQRMTMTSWPSPRCGLPAVSPQRVTSEETGGQAQALEEGENPHSPLSTAGGRHLPPRLW